MKSGIGFLMWFLGAIGLLYITFGNPGSIILIPSLLLIIVGAELINDK